MKVRIPDEAPLTGVEPAITVVGRLLRALGRGTLDPKAICIPEDHPLIGAPYRLVILLVPPAFGESDYKDKGFRIPVLLMGGVYDALLPASDWYAMTGLPVVLNYLHTKRSMSMRPKYLKRNHSPQVFGGRMQGIVVTEPTWIRRVATPPSIQFAQDFAKREAELLAQFSGQ